MSGSSERVGAAEVGGLEAIGAEAVGAEAVGTEAVGTEAVGTEATGPEATGAEYAEDVVLAADLHMRPAGAVVRTAARYTADVELVAAGRVARASSVLEIMGLGARAGTPVTIRGRGTDAEAAVGGLALQLRDTA